MPPTLLQTVLDSSDPRALAEFYRRLFGFDYRPGDEPPASGPDAPDWLVLLGPAGERLAFQLAVEVTPTTWPDPGVPQQLHLDACVETRVELDVLHDRVLELGGSLRFDRSDDPDEPLRVYADPAGHLVCLFVG